MEKRYQATSLPGEGIQVRLVRCAQDSSAAPAVCVPALFQLLLLQEGQRADPNPGVIH